MLSQYGKMIEKMESSEKYRGVWVRRKIDVGQNNHDTFKMKVELVLLRKKMLE